MKRKILLVEDEVLLAMAKQQELARYNYETSHVTTGEKAVDLVCSQNEPIDLILMDINLGRGIDGTEAARQILEYKEVPIVFLSSHEEPEIVEKTEKITSYGYVVKSSSITVLDASIKMAFKLYDTKKNLTIHQKILEQNEQDLKTSQHIARLGSWRLDLATNKVTWTDELYKMYGFDPSLPPPAYTEHMKLFTPESWERLSAALEETVKTGKPYTLELEMSKESKSIGWMWVKGEAVQDKAGKTIELWGAAQDITEKRRSENALRLSEELLDETGKMVRTGGWEVDVAGETVYWTKATKMIYEVPENFEPTIDGAMSYFPGESGERLREAFRRAVEEGVDYDLELDFITAKGNALKVRDIGRAVFNDGKCHKVYGVFQDITEGKELIKRLEYNQNLFKSILRILPGSLNVVDRDLRILMSNKEQYLLNQPNNTDNIGTRCYQIFQKQSKPCPWCHVLDSIQNDSVFEEITDEEDPRTKITGRYWHIYTIPFKNADGENVGAIEYAYDITEIKNFEQKLKESEEKYRGIFENSAFGIFRSTPKGKYEIVNKAFARILGFDSPKGMLNEVTDISKLYKYPEDRERIKKEFSEKGFVEDYEVLTNHPENEIAWISINASQRQYPDGSFYYEGTIQDITERKLAEEELRLSLKDKDFLMKELNHRVKNSLLMVSSLISLQDSETEINISDIQHQIEAISLIHEKLYQSESVVDINSKDYFGDLLDSIFSSFTKRGVRIEKSIQDLYLTTKTAMTLGLIINEIATNAIKHGFTDNEESVFSITMEMDIKNNQLKIILSNSGKPFPEDVDIESTNTLGLRLINALVAQLGGTVALQRKPNPMFTIKIPIED